MKLSLSRLTSGYRSVEFLNAILDDLEIAFENTLSRDGTTPNVMLADLDHNTNRIINLDDSLKGGMRNDVYHIESSKYHNISKNILEQKWGLEFEGSWTQEKLNKLPKKSKIPNFIFNPYFEKNVENLQEKGYVV